MFVMSAFAIFLMDIDEGDSPLGAGDREVTIEMWQWWDDGWQGAKIEVYIDGTHDSDATLVGSVGHGTHTFIVSDGDQIQLYWVGGSNDYACAFVTYYTDTPPAISFDPFEGHSEYVCDESLLACAHYGEMESTADGSPLLSWQSVRAPDYASGAKNETAKTLAISTEEELGLFGHELSFDGTKYDGWTITLTNDLDLSDYKWYPVNMAGVVFNGNGHTIAGMYVNDVLDIYQYTDDDWGDVYFSYAGLFGIIEESTIKNLTLSTPVVDITASWETEENVFIGTIAGMAVGSQIRDVTIEDPVVSLERIQVTAFLGGAVGYACGGSSISIINGVVVNEGAVRASDSLGHAAKIYMGGVAGANYNGALGNSAVYGTDISLTEYYERFYTNIFVGGMTGYTSVDTEAGMGQKLFCVMNNISTAAIDISEDAFVIYDLTIHLEECDICGECDIIADILASLLEDDITAGELLVMIIDHGNDCDECGYCPSLNSYYWFLNQYCNMVDTDTKVNELKRYVGGVVGYVLNDDVINNLYIGDLELFGGVDIGSGFTVDRNYVFADPDEAWGSNGGNGKLYGILNGVAKGSGNMYAVAESIDDHMDYGMDVSFQRLKVWLTDSKLPYFGDYFVPVYSAAIDITAPAEGGTPQTSIADGAGYTGTASWSDDPTVFGDGEYTVTVTLTAKEGYFFTQETGFTATLGGNVANVVSNDAKTVTMTYTYAGTDPGPDPDNNDNIWIIVAVLVATAAALIGIFIWKRRS
ncbi:MAG: hypothetical protein LBV13_00420 [Methanomassiliicoccaceae archaeon]|jgi:hypothetical protein|nr:hypothetical protein [Methanomassiliicoccaceae archaeon]